MSRGGAETLVLTLCQEMKRQNKNIDFHVLVLFEGGDFKSAFESAGIAVDCLNAKKNNFVIRLFKIISYILRYKPDVVHTHLRHADLYGQLAAILTGIKIRIVTLHEERERIRCEDKFFYRIVFFFVSHVVAVSGSTLDSWGKRKILPKKKTLVIYNAPGFTQDSIPKAQHLAGEKCIKLLCLGNIHPVKGHIFAIMAINEIRRDFDSYILNIYGKDRNRYSEVLFHKIKELRLDKIVNIMGPTDNSKDVLEKHDILLMPSISEGLSLVVIEAMSVGIPVIASDIPSHREAFENGVSGILIDIKNLTLFADTIVELSKNKELYSKLSMAGIKRSFIFKRENISQKYLELYSAEKR